MRFKLLSIILFCITVSCKEEALSDVAEQTNHFNHKIFEENKLPPKATFFGFETADILDKKSQNVFLI